MSAWIPLAIVLVAVPLLFAPTIYAFVRGHRDPWVIAGVNLLVFLLGPLGTLAAVIALVATGRAAADAAAEMEAESQCSACGAGYRTSDYRDGRRMLCSRCGADL